MECQNIVKQIFLLKLYQQIPRSLEESQCLVDPFIPQRFGASCFSRRLEDCRQSTHPRTHLRPKSNRLIDKRHLFTQLVSPPKAHLTWAQKATGRAESQFQKLSPLAKNKGAKNNGPTGKMNRLIRIRFFCKVGRGTEIDKESNRNSGCIGMEITTRAQVPKPHSRQSKCPCCPKNAILMIRHFGAKPRR